MKEFYEDKPIQTKLEDLYGRNRLVENIAKVIDGKTKKQHSSFTIGLYGAWGEGKTSVLNLLREKLSGIDNLYQCSFNPWMLSDQESIMQEFFIALQHSLNIDKLPKLIDKVKRYGGLISYVVKGLGYLLDCTLIPGSSIVSGSIAKRLNEVRDLLPDQKPLNEQKVEINTALRNENTHIIVYVDDLDRLDKDEVRAVFRLIRQVADFDNVIYIVAMDVDKVASAISPFYGNDKQEGYRFIEKIINFPIILPQINPQVLKEYADSQLEDMLDANFISTDEYRSFLYSLSQLFSTKREWVRYLNNLQVMLDLTKDEVNLCDMCLIEALRTIAPAVESLIYKGKELLCGSVETTSVLDKEFQETKNKKSKLFDDVINQIPTTKQVISRNILNKLFPEQYNGLNYKYVVDKRICSPIYFDKYFIKQILNEYISDIEIDNVAKVFIEADIADIVSWIDTKIDKYSIDETMRALEMMITRQATTERKKTIAYCIIKGLIYTKEIQRYSYTLFVDGKGNSSCTKLMLVWFPNYIANDMPNAPRGLVKADVESIGELMNYIMKNASIAYCINLLTNFDYLYRTILTNPPIKYFKEACASIEKRLYEIGNKEFIKYSPFLHLSLFRFWNEVDKEGLNKFFKQLVNDTSIDLVAYINKLEEGEELLKLIVELPSLYEMLLTYVKEKTIQPSSKGIERILSNQSLLDIKKKQRYNN